MDLFGGNGGNGMGGPGSGMMQIPQDMWGGPFADRMDWLQFQGAGGYGMGPYGYPAAYHIPAMGQQNMMLNDQWGWDWFRSPFAQYR